MESGEFDEELAKALAMSLENTIHPPSGLEPVERSNETPAGSSNQWYPNLNYVQVLLSMGISENAAVRGLYNTGNTSPDLAAAWVFDNLEDPQLHQPFSPPAGPPVDVKSIQATIDESRLFKMIFIVNTSLKMGVGKVAAQVGHATLALYKMLLIDIGQQQNVRDWEEKGAKKIVLRGNDEEHLMLLKSEAKGLHIPHIIIKDAGKTQVEPGSITVLAVFGKGYEVDEVTGKLSLL